MENMEKTEKEKKEKKEEKLNEMTSKVENVIVKNSVECLLDRLLNESTYKIIFFHQKQSIGNTIPCLGILLEKKGPILSIAYPYILVFNEGDSNSIRREDSATVYPYNGLDFTEYSGEVEADGVLYLNADSISNGYLLYTSKSKHPFISSYLRELENIRKYYN